MVQEMTLDQAQQIYDALVQAQIDDPLGTMGSVTVKDRSVQYRSADDLIKLINYYARLVAQLRRVAAGQSRIGYMLPNFRERNCR
jgi:hypothetical protein